MSQDYQTAKQESRQIDQTLGFEIESCEKKILEIQNPATPQIWKGLDPETLQTPYCEIRSLFSQIKLPPGVRVVDLGCAYGRVAWVLSQMQPDFYFLGIESVEIRALEAIRVLGPRFQNDRLQILTSDVTQVRLGPADVFFIYDFGTRSEIKKALINLKDLARLGPITLVGRGRATRDQIENHEPWLTEIVAPVFLERAGIYRSSPDSF